jgi:peptidoglycan-associated lipoprotein
MRRLLPLLTIVLAAEFIFTACHKNRPPMAPLPQPPEATTPAPPGPPVCKLTAEPAAVDQGSSVTLSWTSQNATDVNIDPTLGKQLTEGSTTASPSESTTYILTATGPGGSATCTARVTVSAVAPPAPSVSEENIQGAAGAASNALQDIFFDYDSADLRPDAENTLKADAAFLKAHPGVAVSIQGNCDQRGSEEYNLGLGQRRAAAARSYLANLGVPANEMTSISYGKDRLVCTDNTEDCWQRNRRDHFELKSGQ